MTIDTQEFRDMLHRYCREAIPTETIISLIDAHCDRQLDRETGLLKLVLGDMQLDLKHAREAYVELEAHCLRLMDKLAAQPPAYIGMSQASLGAEARGYVRGWNDCVDVVKGKGQ